jgi:hypothetical protein
MTNRLNIATILGIASQAFTKSSFTVCWDYADNF